MTEMKLAYTVDEAAELVSLSRSTIENEIRKGALPVKRVGEKGGKRLVLKADLESWVQKLND